MQTIAIIGSRHMTPYGKEVVELIVPVLVINNVRIITARTNGVNAQVARVTRLFGGKVEIITSKVFEETNVKIAEISDKLIVVEGGKNSGTILVAKAFLDLNKEVWAVPGRINDESAWATNFLISNGAMVLTDVCDII